MKSNACQKQLILLTYFTIILSTWWFSNKNVFTNFQNGYIDYHSMSNIYLELKLNKTNRKISCTLKYNNPVQKYNIDNNYDVGTMTWVFCRYRFDKIKTNGTDENTMKIIISKHFSINKFIYSVFGYGRKTQTTCTEVISLGQRNKNIPSFLFHIILFYHIDVTYIILFYFN